jgi:hypothetical protein
MSEGNIEITVDNSELKRVVSAFPGALERAIQLTAMTLHANIRKEAPLGKNKSEGKGNTSNLRGSWQVTKLGSLEWALNSKAIYRWMVQTGTKAHIIKPKNTKALHFTVKGSEIFCKIVHHPGTAANPYITRAIEETKKRIPEFADKAVKEATSGTK